jgi:uncharacterized membrane-anchored protein YitT (DUF2179 family)
MLLLNLHPTEHAAVFRFHGTKIIASRTTKSNSLAVTAALFVNVPILALGRELLSS